jgi:exosome complex component RRP42
MVVVDICTINAGGNLLDASALAGMAALIDARFPKYENEELDYKTRTDKRIELSKKPIAVTVYRVGPHFFVDPIVEEEKEIDARLTVTLTEDGTICALQKGGDQPLTTEDIGRMLEIATEKSKFLREKL